MDTHSSFRETYDCLAQTHFVPDIILPTSTLIFILESPHVQELKYGAPVSGSSGATMSKHLFGEKYARLPLGLLIKKNADEQKNRPRLNLIGLMNVSNIPLQAVAYGPSTARYTRAEWMRAMEHVRSNNQTTDYRQPSFNEVQGFLAETLRNRLSLLTHRSCTLVPCGRFAQKFFRLANQKSVHWNVIEGVPHPSYNSWDRVQYQEVVQTVKESLEAGLEFKEA